MTPIMSKDQPDRLAIDGEGIRVGIIAARFNFQLVNALLESVVGSLSACGVKDEDVETFRVSGSNEIPHVAALLAKTGDFDVIIGLGLIIKGDTDHAAIIGHGTELALQTVGLEFEVPVINGIITVNTVQQAEDRITGEMQRGAEFAHAALEMAQLNQTLVERVMKNDMDAAIDDLDMLDDDEFWEDLDEDEDDLK